MKKYTNWLMVLTLLVSACSRDEVNFKKQEGEYHQKMVEKCKKGGGVWAPEYGSCFEDPAMMVGPGDPDYRPGLNKQ